MARAGEVWVAARAAGRARSGRVLAVVVVTDGFLLGGFIALLAVRPEASRAGAGQPPWSPIVADARLRQAALAVRLLRRRNNRAALRFYRRLGFARVGRLPDLVSAGASSCCCARPVAGETRT